MEGKTVKKKPQSFYQEPYNVIHLVMPTFIYMTVISRLLGTDVIFGNDLMRAFKARGIFGISC
jgi:hypothetical protein